MIRVHAAVDESDESFGRDLEVRLVDTLGGLQRDGVGSNRDGEVALRLGRMYGDIALAGPMGFPVKRVIICRLSTTSRVASWATGA